MTSPELKPAREIYRLGVAQIATRIATGELSAREVVDAHIARLEATSSLNALVIPLFSEARKRADELDEQQRRGSLAGLLHGVPVTIKDCFHVRGTPSTIGIERFAAQTIADDGPLVARLRAAGAVVLGKTNVPQLMVLHETDNPVYGQTNNPWNAQRSPGGSSGGEAAVIAAGGSPLGLASDLGGSIRQPAHSCGIHGIKPTTGRLTKQGSRNALRGMEAIGLQAGPLARRVEDLALALRALVPDREGDRRTDELPVSLPDPAQIDVAGLRIGVWESDDYFPASPAIRRAVREAGAALSTAGADIVSFAPPSIDECMRLYLGLVSADRGNDARRLLGDSPRDWRVARLLRLANHSALYRRLLVRSLGWGGHKRLAELTRIVAGGSADHYWQLVAARRVYGDRFFTALDAAGIDALVCPPHAMPALRHGSSLYLPLALCYSFLANLVNVPAGVVSTTRIRAGEETDRPTSRDVVMQAAREVELGSAGLPVGVQVIGRPWREDIVLAVMAALEGSFEGQADYPGHGPEAF